MKRMRGRNHRPGGSGGGFRNQQNGIPLNRNHVFDSSGPEMRVRGTAQQLYDKYTQLARDAAASADRVLSEAHYQHAEHYFRVLSAINAAQGLPPPGQNGNELRYNNGQPQGEFQRVEQAGETGDMAEPRQDQRSERPDNREFRDNREQNNRQERRFEPRQRQDFQPRERQDFQPRERQDFQPRERQEFQPRERQDFQPRERKEFQPRERQDRPYRPMPEVADTPIDISSALEAELRATIPEEPREMIVELPAVKQPQAVRPIQPAKQPPQPAKAPVPARQQAAEPRAIPITPDAPPPTLTLTEPASSPAPKRRGRPPRAKSTETT